MSGRIESMRSILTVFCSGLITWIADVASKCWALNHDRAEIVTLIPALLYALVPPLQNRGTGNLLPGMKMPGGNQFLHPFAVVVPIILSIAAFAWMYRIEYSQPGAANQGVATPPKLTTIEKIGFGMLLGGTFSNLYDRIVQGSVTDFLSLTIVNFWMWNIADVGIALGLFLVGIEALRLKRLFPSIVVGR